MAKFLNPIINIEHNSIILRELKIGLILVFSHPSVAEMFNFITFELYAGGISYFVGIILMTRPLKKIFSRNALISRKTKTSMKASSYDED